MGEKMKIAVFLQKESNIPLYVQLYEQIKTEILTGRLKKDIKLPSIRELAQELNISKNTVSEAYQQLLAEGFIESKFKKGYWVVDISDYHSIIRDPIEITEPIKEDFIENKIVYDFQYGDVDLAHFPLKAWQRSIQDSLLKEDKEILLYGDKRGNKNLRTEISRYLYRSRGIKCNEDQVIIGAGIEILIKKITSLFSIEDLIVGMEDPGYDGVRGVLEEENSKVVDIPVCEINGYDVDTLLNSSARLAYITPSHQFPLGHIMPITKRLQLLQWANEKDGYIIEDDYDSEFRYQGSPISSLKGMDTQDRVIYLGTFSKSFLPSLRIGYLILPLKLMEQYKKYRHGSQSASSVLQHALSVFMENGEFDRHLRRMRKIYHDKHKCLVNAIDFYMGGKVVIIGEKAGLHLLLQVPNKNHDELIKLAECRSIKVYSTKPYYKNNKYDNYIPIMLGFGGLSKQEIEEGIKNLSMAWFS